MSSSSFFATERFCSGSFYITPSQLSPFTISGSACIQTLNLICPSGEEMQGAFFNKVKSYLFTRARCIVNSWIASHSFAMTAY